MLETRRNDVIDNKQKLCHGQQTEIMSWDKKTEIMSWTTNRNYITGN